MSKKTHEYDSSKSMLENYEDILKAKGIWDSFQLISPSILEKRVMMGFIRKRSKGKTKYFQTRFFILVSARQIRKDQGQDEKVLRQDSLPSWMELETMYYFNDKEILTDATFLGTIPLKDCVGVVLKDMTKSKDKGYTFKVDMGDRIFPLNSETTEEGQLWVDAINASIETMRQQKSSKFGGLEKNIAPLMQLADEEGLEKLQDKIIDDFLKIQVDYPINDIDNIEEYFMQKEKLTEELLQTLDACVALNPPRKDIVSEYLNIFHEKACQLPRIYFENNRDKINNLEIIQILNWLFSYTTSLKKVGIVDERLNSSIETLSTLITKRMLKAGIEMIFNILMEVRDMSLTESEQEIKQTTGPLDLFKVFNGIFDNYRRCQKDLMATKILATIKRQTLYYLEGLEILLKKVPFNLQKYIGLSNDTLLYIRNLNEFISNVQEITNMDLEKIESAISKEDLQARFVQVGNIAFEKLVDSAFQDLAKHFKVNFMELKAEDTLSSIIEQATGVMSSLHTSYSNKVWKLILEKSVILYIQCLFNSSNKLKIKEISVLTNKINEDKETFRSTFTVVGTSVMEACLKALDDLLTFFDTSPALIPMSILELRKSNGPGFTMQTVKALLNLRVDLTSSEKSEAMSGSKEIIAKYKEENKNEVASGTHSNLFNRVEITMDADEFDKDDVKEEKVEEKKEEKTKEEEQAEDKANEEPKVTTMSGTLEKKSAGFTKAWEKRHFAVKNDKIYWYDNTKASIAANHLDLKNLIKCEAVKKKQLQIVSQGKTYQLKAATTEERDEWVKFINERLVEVRAAQNADPTQAAPLQTIYGATLFHDYDYEWVNNLKDPLVQKVLTFPGNADKKKQENLLSGKGGRSQSSAVSNVTASPDNSKKRMSIALD